jgi:hypothetical protein
MNLPHFCFTRTHQPTTILVSLCIYPASIVLVSKTLNTSALLTQWLSLWQTSDCQLSFHVFNLNIPLSQFVYTFPLIGPYPLFDCVHCDVCVSLYSTAQQVAYVLENSCRKVVVAISGTLSEFASNKEHLKLPSVWVSDSLTASVPKITLGRRVSKAKL